MKDYKIYCDGACSGNPGPGAWAYAVLNEKQELIACASGLCPYTTNNCMELMAAINAAHAFDDCTIIVDSNYVKEGITKWINKWKINGWKTASGLVKNIDLWTQLDVLVSKKNINWAWEKGHNNGMHDIVDKIAREAVYKPL